VPLVEDVDVLVLFGRRNSMVWAITGFIIVPLSVTVGEVSGIVTSQTFPWLAATPLSALPIEPQSVVACGVCPALGVSWMFVVAVIIAG
jgi:hypothetical protein